MINMKTLNEDIKKIEQAFSKYKESKKHLMELENEKQEFEDLKDEKFMQMLNACKYLNEYAKEIKTTGNCDKELEILNSRQELIFSNPDLSEYFNCLKSIDEMNNFINKIITEEIKLCGLESNHYCVFIENELICAKCCMTTKNYIINDEIKNFLLECVKAQGLLIQDVEKEDLPLIELLIKRTDKKKALMDGNLNCQNCLDLLDEYYLTDDLTLFEIQQKVQNAHVLDNKLKTNQSNSPLNFDVEYLLQEEFLELQENLLEEIKTIKKHHNINRDDLLQKCKIKKYEIEILSGKSIIEIFNNIKNKKEKQLFIQAYLNVMDEEYRIKSGYFKTEYDAIQCNCITANQEINRLALKL